MSVTDRLDAAIDVGAGATERFEDGGRIAEERRVEQPRNEHGRRQTDERSDPTGASGDG